MLSYRHSFHAGNAADVLKHLTLILCLDYLTQKEKPLLCVDTHAGAGVYGIEDPAGPADGKADNTAGRERQNGIKRLRAFAAGPNGTVPAPVTRYLELTAGENYPGSPLIMAKLLREKDRLVCFELHPRDAGELRRNMEAFKKTVEKAPAIEVRKEDGPFSLKALLPPISRRGLIFIDPSWEEKSEYENIAQAVQEGLKRFAEGTFIVWYPLLSKPKAALAWTARTQTSGETPFFPAGRGKRCQLELYTNAALPSPESPRGMYGSGLVIHNPPWTLRPALEQSLPCLARALGGPSGSWRFDWTG